MTDVKSTSVLLEWSPSFDGNSAIVQYIVQYAGGIENTKWSAGEKTNSQQPSYAVTKLHPYANYTFRVAATNLIGTGDFSNSSSVALTSQDSKQRICMLYLLSVLYVLLLKLISISLRIYALELTLCMSKKFELSIVSTCIYIYIYAFLNWTIWYRTFIV